MNDVQETVVTRDAAKIRQQFHGLLAKANKEHPRPADVEALSNLLYENKEMELWKNVMGMGALAEHTVLEAELGAKGQGSRKCWEMRLASMRSALGQGGASPLEQLLIQQVTLCWLNLNLVEYKHSNIMKQSITLTLGMYWEKRLTAAQRRAETTIVRPLQAAVIAGVSVRTINRWVESNRIHFMETADGLLFLCVNSLSREALPTYNRQV